MSKFQSTISVVAALASIFGAGAAGWKLAQDSEVKTTESPDNPIVQTYEQHITELQKEVSTLKEQAVNVNPPNPVRLPEPPVNTQQSPKPTVLPPAAVASTNTAASAPPPPPTNQQTFE